MSAKDKENAPAAEPGVQRQKRSKEKLIRLDDLIPKEKVTGGRQLFGAQDSDTITQNQT